MPRILTGAGILVALFAPSLALAASNDVTLTVDTVLSVAGITLNVSGSTASIESITVNAGNFSVTMQSGSSFQVTAPGLNRLTASTLTGVSSDICSASQSLLAYAPSTSVTVTITPSSTLCSSTSSGGSTSTGGGGGSATVSATPATPAVPASTTTPAVPAVPATPATPATPASGLSSEQVTSILAVLVSFGVDDATVATIQAILLGTGSTGASTPSIGSFARDLELGVTGADVKALQVFLNTHGYAVAINGAGSSGNETTKFGGLTKAALIKYQKAKSITPAVGYFGPKTRAAVEAD